MKGLHTNYLKHEVLYMNHCPLFNREIIYCSSSSPFCQGKKGKEEPWEKVLSLQKEVQIAQVLPLLMNTEFSVVSAWPN